MLSKIGTFVHMAQVARLQRHHRYGMRAIGNGEVEVFCSCEKLRERCPDTASAGERLREHCSALGLL